MDEESFHNQFTKEFNKIMIGKRRTHSRIIMIDDNNNSSFINIISQPFDIEKESVYCAFCGKKREPAGHITSQFLMCPDHGEFTPYPVVVMRNGKWNIIFQSETALHSWNTCKGLEEDRKNEEQTKG